MAAKIAPKWSFYAYCHVFEGTIIPYIILSHAMLYSRVTSGTSVSVYIYIYILKSIINALFRHMSRRNINHQIIKKVNCCVRSKDILNNAISNGVH